MGLYGINCSKCGKPFLWFSGNMDTRCPECVAQTTGLVPDLDVADKIINKTKMKCGHQPCSLVDCKSCSEHCQQLKRRKK